MSPTETPRATTVYELTEISALALGKYTALAGLLGSVAMSILLVGGYENPSFTRGLAMVATAVVGLTLGGFLAGVVLATLYNILARYLGGLRLHLAPLSRGEAGLPATNTKICPQCQATLRADLSFCPECDHKFPREA